jgi:hypothetical protein
MQPMGPMSVAHVHVTFTVMPQGKVDCSNVMLGVDSDDHSQTSD